MRVQLVGTGSPPPNPFARGRPAKLRRFDEQWPEARILGSNVEAKVD
jgi:hypothetical protein